ncbi:PfkB family carbohydrate kinase [Selenomonas sp. F0473]|uniref:PfkB family carbohydrate kinase n=1 Tax=Selenomonas sp. F0473 TaxID=999423 RepID=UPI0025E6183E|nr:PfkB family carbohydrate kinase [Selenomonas sp. F0473]
MTDEKIISKEDFLQLRQKFRDEGKRVVLCHGVFDLLHYGHIEHLEEAKRQGDILVVSVTAAKYVNKGPGRPYFDDRQRMAFLASLEIVNYVLLSEAVTVHEIVSFVQPDVYSKGQEYARAEDDVTGNIREEQRVVEKYGGKIYFTQGEVHSSTKLLNNFFAALPENVKETAFSLRKKYGVNAFSQIRGMIDDFSNSKVLVVGDVIIDAYVFCNVQGVTMKDATLSAFCDSEENYAGGSLAIARHLANISQNVTLLSMMGTEDGLRVFIEEKMDGVQLELLQNESFVTPVKRRYLKQNPVRQEYTKLFSVNYLLKRGQRRRFDYSAFHQKLRDMTGDYDLVIVCDYGHGLLDDEGIRILEEKAKFLAVNCQTNSSNYGTNLITKYRRADCFVVDERELRLAFGQALTPRHRLLQELSGKLHARMSWATIGADGAIGNTTDEQVRIPALILRVKDTIGAGDAFYSLAALCASKDVPLDLATLIANGAGALKTNVVGNKEAVRKVDLLKFLSTIMNV